MTDRVRKEVNGFTDRFLGFWVCCSKKFYCQSGVSCGDKELETTGMVKIVWRNGEATRQCPFAGDSVCIAVYIQVYTPTIRLLCACEPLK